MFDKIAELGQRAVQFVSHVDSEEATKTALVLPFIQSLGYDVFNPAEVVPEFTADVGIKRGEKVDYAICRDGSPTILFECKPHGARLDRYSSQLYRYFSVTKARIAVLTDGIEYRFYSDLVDPNKLDEEPFLTLNLIEPKKSAIEQVSKLSKTEFNLDAILESAEDLRYVSKIRAGFVKQLDSPSDAFVRMFVDPIYSGRMTQPVLDRFRGVVRNAIKGQISETVESRIRAALASSQADHASQSLAPDADQSDESDVVTTAEELEGLYAIKAILRDTVEPERVVPRDVRSYFGILLDDNNRKPICRLWFNGRTKYLGVFDEKKSETRIPVAGPNGLFEHADAVIQSAKHALGESTPKAVESSSE